MYPKNHLLAVALCLLIYILNILLIQNEKEVLMAGGEIAKVYIAIIHIIIPILIIRYLLKKHKDDIISIEIVLIFAIFFGRIIYNIIIVEIMMHNDCITLMMILVEGIYFNPTILPAIKSASLIIMIYLLINIIMEKILNSSKITLTKKVIKHGFIYMIYYILYIIYSRNRYYIVDNIKSTNISI